MFDVIIAANEHDDWWQHLADLYPHAIRMSPGTSIVDSLVKAKVLTDTEMFWLITDDWQMVTGHNVDLGWKPPLHDRSYIHRWDASVADRSWAGFRGLYLIPRRCVVTQDEILDDHVIETKPMKDFEIHVRPFDMFFISYDEKYANMHFNKIRDRFPNTRRVHGVKGIANAHRRCAELSNTNMFWTIDADTVIRDDFRFDYLPTEYDRRYLHIWHSENPVNGTQYGWGAVKLWPRRSVLDFAGSYLDYTTTAGQIKIIDSVAAISDFNQDGLTAWRSGFRETVKLCENISNGDHDESLARLHAWLTVALDVPFAGHARSGAHAGVEFWKSTDDIMLINNFDWLAKRFADGYSNSDHDSVTLYGDRDALLRDILSA